MCRRLSKLLYRLLIRVFVQLCLQLERFFERQTDGEFEPYVPQSQSAPQSRQRVIYTRLKLYTVNMLFDLDQKVLLDLLSRNT